MWSRTVAALEPGQSVQVLLMGIPGESPLVAVVDA
jgi:hypothetical protein